MEEEEFGRVKRSDSREIVFRRTKFKGAYGIDIREYITTATYTGWSKSGIRIPEEIWEDFKQMVNKIEVKKTK